jgi:hypothetical protein
LDKAAFSFAACPANEKNPAFLGDLGALSEAGVKIFFFGLRA